MNIEIMELIQQRRYQLLVNSCIYYELNDTIISDQKWDMWARELVSLQKEYPAESKEAKLYEEFKDWDGSTGAFLPLKEEWVLEKARWLLSGITSNPGRRNRKEEKSGRKEIKPKVGRSLLKKKLF